jgi:hypothetical protein
VDKAELLARKATDNTDTVPIGDIGSVTVRGLSAGEVERAKESDDYLGHLLSAALLDPTMTPTEVRTWLDTAPGGDTVTVIDKVAMLSGLEEGAQKSNVARPRNGRNRRVPVSSGRKAR